MMDMHDKVVLAQVQNGRYRNTAGRPAPPDDRPRAPKELRIRRDEQADIGKLEPLPQPPLNDDD